MLDFVKKLFGLSTSKSVEQPQAPYKVEPQLDPISKPEPEQAQDHVKVEEKAPTTEATPEKKPRTKKVAEKKEVETEVKKKKKTSK